MTPPAQRRQSPESGLAARTREKPLPGPLAAGAGAPPLADRVRARCLGRAFDYPHAGRGENSVECVGVLAIPVPDQEFQSVGPLAKVHERFPARCTVQAAGWAQPNEDQVKKTEGHEI